MAEFQFSIFYCHDYVCLSLLGYCTPLNTLNKAVRCAMAELSAEIWRQFHETKVQSNFELSRIYLHFKKLFLRFLSSV